MRNGIPERNAIDGSLFDVGDSVRELKGTRSRLLQPRTRGSGGERARGPKPHAQPSSWPAAGGLQAGRGSPRRGGDRGGVCETKTLN